MRKLTQQEFIANAREVHGDKYDYSKVEYKNAQTKVCIICPIHGEFWQRPSDHLSTKYGCPKCAVENSKHFLFGFGINDMELITKEESFGRWYNLLRRCYCEEILKKIPTYTSCTITDEWRYFSAFKEWFDKHYVEGWDLDKDILVKGNKVYSPETCCFVPQEINKLFTKRQRKRGAFPIGVSQNKNTQKTYRACIQKGGKQVYLGFYDNINDAFQAYKVAKEAWIKEVADKWKDKLEPRVYEALYNYEVEITD
jgi:hypothetical protein